MTEHFAEAYQRVQHSYREFQAVLEGYPAEKTEENGALGIWSPKQIVAHLSGWVVRATTRYQDFRAGDTENVYESDLDGFNAQSVADRAHLSWDDTVADLSQAVEAFFVEVKAVPALAIGDDPRYVEWLIGLDKEFRNHGVDLRIFLQDKSATYNAPILEFDPTPQAIITASEHIRRSDEMPERVVFCFFADVIKHIRMTQSMKMIHQFGSEIGKNPVYRFEVDDVPIAVIHPGVGAPLAVAFMEEAIALGGRKFIACGGAGVLSSDIGVGTVVIPESAVRDEGTSYHYLPPSREVSGSPEAITAIKQALAHHNIPYRVGKTWTTDGIYRETRKRADARKAEGCLTVEMETASFFAVAQFRDVIFGQLLYGGDDLGGEAWDHREWMTRTDAREKLFWLAIEAVSKL